MELNINKKGVVFSLLAIFLALLIFIFASLNLKGDEFSFSNEFIDARITFLNSEFIYFKDVYFQDVASYSLYKVLNAIIENETILSLVENDHARLNKFILEGLLYGSINGSSSPNLIYNDTLTYFIEEFNKDFNNNAKGKIEVNINNLNIYEEIPFSVSLQMETNLKVTTLDNISSWNLTENFFIRTSIVELYDPEFKIHANKNISIRPFEYFGSYMNWTLGTFKEVLDNSYSSIYYDTEYKYSLGNSFLNRLLNYKVSSYDSTVLYLSFVHDDFEKGIYDSSLYNGLGDLYANTRILYTFNNNTINSSINQIYDLSSYNNSGKISSVPINASSCVNSECAFFTSNSKINISDSKNILNISDTFSFSIWFKLNTYTPSASILSYNRGGFGNSTETNDGFLLGLRYADPTQLRFIVGNTSEINSVRTNISLSLDSWNHVVGIFDKGKLELYLNGILSGRVYTSFTNLKYLDKNLLLGKANHNTYFSFNGSLDEFAFYSKALNQNEIAYLYGQREAKFIDYVDSLYDKGIYFDGIDDYLKIDLNDSLDNFMNDSFSIEFWLKTNNFGVYDILNYTSELYIGLNNSNLVFGDDVTNKINIPIEFIPVIYNYVVITYENASKILKVYNNGKLKNQSVFNLNSALDGGNLLVGGKNNFFRGIIDEIKFSKKILSSKDVENLYFNYRSFSGGCCNYISLINPNLLGYNTSNFDDLNISYSSRLFFDNISMNNFLPNITLFNVTNITSSETFKNYYQFKVDTCLFRAFDIPSILNGTQPAGIIKVGFDGDRCKDLIRMGIY